MNEYKAIASAVSKSEVYKSASVSYTHLERRETVRSLSGVGVGYLRGAVLSTRGPGWTDLCLSLIHI